MSYGGRSNDWNQSYDFGAPGSVLGAFHTLLATLWGIEYHLHLKLWMCSKYSKSQWLKRTPNLPSALNSMGWHFDWTQLGGSSSVSWAPSCVCGELPSAAQLSFWVGCGYADTWATWSLILQQVSLGFFTCCLVRIPWQRAEACKVSLGLGSESAHVSTSLSAKLSHKASPDEEVKQETSSFWKAIILQRMVSTGKGIIAATFADIPHSLYKWKKVKLKQAKLTHPSRVSQLISNQDRIIHTYVTSIATLSLS